MQEETLQILSTTDYDRFTVITSNREVSAGHVENIKISIGQKNLLKQNPIIVNSQYRVVDGQHRLQAARELRLPIFFVVSDEVTNEDISRLNTNKKNWRMEDFLVFWQVEGKSAYGEVGKFMKAYPKIPLTAALLLLGADYKGVLNDFKGGTFQIATAAKATTMADEVLQLSSYGKHVFSLVFIRAYNKVARHPKFDFSKLVYQIQKAPLEFVPSINDRGYAELFERIYNRDVKGQNRVDFKKISDDISK